MVDSGRSATSISNRNDDLPGARIFRFGKDEHVILTVVPGCAKPTTTTSHFKQILAS